MCTSPYRDRLSGSAPVPGWQRVTFYSGIALALVALATPLDTIGDTYLFTAHMLQHLLLILGVAPLLLAGTPSWLLRQLLVVTHLVGFVRWARHPLAAFFGFHLVFCFTPIHALFGLSPPQSRH